MTRNPDAHVTLGHVTNYEGVQLPVFRVFDGLDLCSVTILMPKGVRELEKRIADYWNALARYRLRELDFDSLGIDLDECRDWMLSLSSLADGSDPRNLELVDWVALGARLERLRPYGYDELRKLHGLLMADETPEPGPLCSGCGDPAGTDPTPIENDGVICADCADEAKAAGSFPFEPRAES